MTDLELKIKAWCDKEYPRDLPGRLRKLGEEFGELAEAVARGQRKEIIEEAGDCGLILKDICGILNVSLDDAIETKLFIKQALAEREEVRLGGA